MPVIDAGQGSARPPRHNPRDMRPFDNQAPITGPGVRIMLHRAIIAIIFVFVGSAVLAGCEGERREVATSRAAPPEAQGTPVGTVSFSVTGFALGLGYESGNGTLGYQGRQYPFRLSGISAIDIGVSSVSGSGEVYNLKRLQDFNGTYTSFAAEATLAGGAGFAYLRNQNAVVVKVTSTSQGLRFRLAPEGLKITLTPS
jgi:hypothetical protein